MRTLDLDQFWPFDPEPVGERAATAVGTIKHSGAPLPPPLAKPLFTNTNPRQPLFDFGPHPSDATARLSAAIFAATAGKYQNRARTFLRTFDAYAASWASIGFVSGMVAWHAVGFWGFVSQTVLAHNDVASPSAYVREAAPQRAAPAPITTGSLPATAGNASACVALVIDRVSGVPTTAPCPAGARPLKDAGRQRRGNLGAGEHARLENADTWAAATALDNNQIAAKPNPADFDLTLPPDLNGAKIASPAP